MQYENKILNFHIYLYFPSNIFKKFKNIKKIWKFVCVYGIFY